MITNNHNLPIPFLEATRILEDTYKKGACDFSVTELISPPRIGAMRRRMSKEGERLTVDCKDRYHALQGTALHYYLEALGQLEHYDAEVRLMRDIDGVTIAGTPDLVDKERFKIYDWKTAFMATFKDGVKPQYEQQLNINNWLVGGDHSLAIIALYRDYRVFNPSQVPVEQIEVEAWGSAETEEFLRERIRLHQEADRELPECTAEEIWEKPAKWVVQNEKGNTVRGGLHPTEESAVLFKEDRKDRNKLTIAFRAEERTRCQYFCDMASRCEVYQAWKANNPQ